MLSVENMLSWMLALVALVVAVVHLVFPKCYHSLSFERTIRKIPGPPTLPYVGTKVILSVNNDGFLQTMMKMTKLHKPLLRLDVLGTYTVVVSEVNDAEIIMNSRSHITKSVDYDFIHPWLGQGLLTSTGEKWFTSRRMLTPAFHFGIIEQYIDIFSKNAQILVDKLGTYRTQAVSVNPLVSLCTLDIVCGLDSVVETAMGTVVNAQSGGEKEYVDAVLEMSMLFQIRQLSPWLYRDCLFQLFPTGKRQKKVLQILHTFTEKVIDEKMKLFQKNKENPPKEDEDVFQVKKKRSFLDLLVEISELEGKLTRQEIREEVDTFMFEGHDTTAAAISWALFELGLNPEIQSKAQEEQDLIFRDSQREPTSTDLAEMKYLERIIKETLRLYPSVPIIGRGLREDVTLSGYKVPAGANVGIFIYNIHRDDRLYPDPNRFDPDRFLQDRIAKRHPYSYIPFSAGPRNCIGQKFALLEEKVVLSHILRRYNIKSLTAKEEIKLMAELILRPKESFKILFATRSSHNDKV